MIATARQPIPVVRDIALVVTALLDAQLACAQVLDYVSPVALLPKPSEYAECHAAVMRWAAAHGCEVRRSSHDETSVHQIHMRIGEHMEHIAGLHVPAGCDFDIAETAPDLWRPSDAEVCL